MEIDQQGEGCEVQDQDQVKVMSSKEQTGGSQSKARQFECIFCKKQLKNAQALGGHMNLHKKEKVKLIELTSGPSSKNMITTDFLKMIQTTKRLPRGISLIAAEGHGHGGANIKTTLTLETPPFLWSEGVFEGSSFQRGSAVSELDLELRLGLK